MDIINKPKDVVIRLNELYEERMANVLLGAWLVITLHGEEFYKNFLGEKHLNRHKKLLQKAGCVWSPLPGLKNLNLDLRR